MYAIRSYYVISSMRVFNRSNLILLKSKEKNKRQKALDVTIKASFIGPETADDILLYACEKPVFVVDAYTRRIFIV